VANLKNGALVYIPQAVTLVDVANLCADDPQMTIPLRVRETTSPTVGVVVERHPERGLLQVYCEGERWAVKDVHVYPLPAEE
tara:strand:- start:1679 stop:1924 length:246 start_codon:yes stop_codon:yes gene_type:complete